MTLTFVMLNRREVTGKHVSFDWPDSNVIPRTGEMFYFHKDGFCGKVSSVQWHIFVGVDGAVEKKCSIFLKRPKRNT